eukprot:1791208-Rhodomonas_salina.3
MFQETDLCQAADGALIECNYAFFEFVELAALNMRSFSVSSTDPTLEGSSELMSCARICYNRQLSLKTELYR